MSRQCQLFGTKVMRGNNVPNSNKKTKRTFNINLHNVSYHSNILNKNINLRLTTRGMRTILKYGGLDECLLEMKSRKLFGICLKLKKELTKKKLLCS